MAAIKFEKNDIVTSTATDQIFLPVVRDPSGPGGLRVVGRDVFLLEWVSGTVYPAVGKVASASTNKSLAAAGDKLVVTLEPNHNAVNEDGIPGSQNLHLIGSGTVRISW